MSIDEPLPQGLAANLLATEGPTVTTPRLAGSIGVPQLVFTVLSYNAPLGVLAGVLPLVIGFGIGLGAPLLFLGLGLMMALFAVGYTTMSRHLDNPGGFYGYVTAGLGKPLGLGAAFIALVSYSVAMIAFLIFTGLALESFIHDTLSGPDIKWWVFTFAFVAIAGVLGYRRIDVSARVMAALLILEIAIVVIWDVVVAARGGAEGHLSFDSFNPSILSDGSIVVGVIFAVTCFGGFEATAVFRDEVRDPDKTISRATYAAIAVITLFYTVASWILIQALGQDNAAGAIIQNPTSAFFVTVNQFLGRVGSDLATLLVVTSGFAALLAYHNVVSRYLFSLGSDGVLPQALGTPHAQLGSPHRASLLLTVTALLAVLVVITVPTPEVVVYTRLVAISGYAFVILLTLAALGIAAYLIRHRPQGHTVWHWAVAPILTAVFMAWVTIASTQKIDLLTGAHGVSIAAVAVAVGTVLTGVVGAVALRATRPDVFARIGRQEGL